MKESAAGVGTSNLAKDDVRKIQSQFSSVSLEAVSFRGEETIIVPLESLSEILAFCAKELSYNFLLDITSIDHYEDEGPRFEIVYELTDIGDTKHLRVKAQVDEGEKAPSVVEIWKTADWHEREIYDMMGIEFEDHPDLRRILMWEGYPHYPLRKDFPLAGLETELPDVAFTGVAPLEGGPFVASPGGDRISSEPRAKGES